MRSTRRAARLRCCSNTPAARAPTGSRSSASTRIAGRKINNRGGGNRAQHIGCSMRLQQRPAPVFRRLACSPAARRLRQDRAAGGGSRRSRSRNGQVQPAICADAQSCRPAGFRGRSARADRAPQRQGAQCGRRHDLGLRSLRLHPGRCARQRQPEPVAPGEAEQQHRLVQSDGRHLSAARLRPRQHHADRRQDRLDRGRYPDLARDRGRRHGVRAQASGRQESVGADIHPQPCRSFRRRAGRHLGRRSGRAQGAYRRP